MLMRPARRRGRGSASHLARVPLVFEPARHACCCEPARRRGKRISRRVSPTVEESGLRTSHADPTPSMRFRLRGASRRSRWSPQHACSPARVCRSGAKCAWKRHGVTFPRRASLGGVSPTVEESLSAHWPRGSAPSDAFPATRCVASLAMVRISTRVSPARSTSAR